jgi:hypothetical protein
VLEVCGGGDDDHVAMLMRSVGASFQQRVHREGALWCESGDAAALCDLEKNVVCAWRAAKRNGDVAAARQCLSLMALRPSVSRGGRYSQSNIAGLMSELLAVNVGDRVRVLEVDTSRNAAKLGVCVAVGVTALPDGGEEKT